MDFFLMKDPAPLTDPDGITDPVCLTPPSRVERLLRSTTQAAEALAVIASIVGVGLAYATF